MSTPRAMRQPLALKIGSGAFLAFWCLLAAFPIVWIAVMSFKSPVDAFASNPFDVILGPETLARGNGLSLLDLLVAALIVFAAARFARRGLARLAAALRPRPAVCLAGSWPRSGSPWRCSWWSSCCCRR